MEFDKEKLSNIIRLIEDKNSLDERFFNTERKLTSEWGEFRLEQNLCYFKWYIGTLQYAALVIGFQGRHVNYLSFPVVPAIMTLTPEGSQQWGFGCQDFEGMILNSLKAHLDGV